MKLSPESVGVIAGRTNAKLSEAVAEAIEEEVGRDVSEAQYDKLSVLLEDAIADALGKLELS